MKFFVMIFMALGMMACSDPNVQQAAKNLNLDQLGEIGSNLAVNAAKTECQNRLESGQGGWSDLVLTAEQKATVCDCVSLELKNRLNAETLTAIIKDGKVDAGVLTGKVTEVMAICTAPQATQAQETASTNEAKQ